MCVHPWYVSSNPLLQAILFSCLLGSAASLPTQNITIDGVTNHGDPHLICTPTKWTDIVSFFLLNYIAHAATVTSFPGEMPATAIWHAFVATLFPTYGVMRGLNLITRHSSLPLGKSNLQKAARSGALCMVVRTTSWTPEKGDSVTDVWVVEMPESGGTIEGNEPHLESHGLTIIPRENTAALSTYVPPWMREASRHFIYTDTHEIYAKSRVVFGAYSLPEGYELAFVPRNTKVLALPVVDSMPLSPPQSQHLPLLFRHVLGPVNPDRPRLSSSHNLIKGAAALLQLLYASFTLYESRGDQIRRYGYAAFGLTVVPYVVMSAFNLFANILTPNYPTLYLVRSEVMDEAERRNGSFDCVVGRTETFVESDTDDTIMEDWYKTSGIFDDGLLELSPGTEQSKKLTVHAASSAASHRRTVYVPACPRFQRTDDIQKMKYKKFSPTAQRHPLQRAQRPQWLSSPSKSLRANPVYRLEMANSFKPRSTEIMLFWMICGIQVAIIGSLSGFHPGGSTLAQRVWTMTWFFFGIFIGISVHMPLGDSNDSKNLRWFAYPLFYGAPAVGGFIVVGQMLKGYGSCLRVG